MDHLCLATQASQAQESPGPLPKRLDRGRARRQEVRGEPALSLEVRHADLVATRRLAAHLREQVDLRAPDIEGRDDMLDPHRSSS